MMVLRYTGLVKFEDNLRLYHELGMLDKPLAIC